MIVLIIIGVLLFILALINWEQSEGFFRNLFKPGKNDSLSEDIFSKPVSHLVDDFSSDEDYAYDDDSDYCYSL